MARSRRMGWRDGALTVLVATAALGAALAADVTRPAAVTGVLATRTSPDVILSWTPVTQDVTGTVETVSSYRVYRGTSPTFVPDLSGGSNRIGTTAGATFADLGAAGSATNYFYLVTAVDAAGNESASMPPLVSGVPVLSGIWTDTTVELNWTAAAPADKVAGYRVYYGKKSHVYDGRKDVGTALSTSMTGLDLWVNYYFAVVAYDVNGNESAFSNEHVDPVAGRVRVRAHDDDSICWGAAKCPPKPGETQRQDGWQIIAPVDFPEGAWTKVSLAYTIDSRLCKVGQNGTTDKCGGTNPGGYNPCGDPWDRIATLFMVQDDCLTTGAECHNDNNLELMRAITPFGTDAPAPLGDGRVPARVLTMDITPFVPILTGHRFIGAEIGHYVQAGWHVTSEFTFSKRADEVSAKKPAAGVKVLANSSAPFSGKTLSIPANATKVVMRLFTSGHGGTQACDGGTNDGKACTGSAQCPGGSCQNCDEFCHRNNRILKSGAPVYQVTPWVTCSTGCSAWNACGFPSCAFSRAGWCPGYIACTNGASPPCDQDIDVTSSFPAGGTYSVGYDVVLNNGQPTTTGSWPIGLVAYWYTN